MRRLAAALIHHPVLDRQGEIVTTAITNLDLHDLARSAHTFGLTDLFIVHPIAAQRELAERVRRHWVEGSGARRIPDRQPAMAIVRVIAALDDAIEALGSACELWSTSASGTGSLSFAQARSVLERDGGPVLLCFGTGWGLARGVLDRAHHRLEPVHSPRADKYNHLSVRAAGAIIFDRLRGVR